MTNAEKTVFISYRRSTSKYLARAVFMDLREHGYDVFLDVNTIDSGALDRIILNQIAARAHFLVLLSPGALKRCVNKGDWLRREIEEAMRLKRNIVPLIDEGFNFDKEIDFIPEGWRKEFRSFSGLRLFPDYFDEGMAKLRSRFLKQPIYGDVIPVTVAEQEEVERRVGETISEGVPTKEELSAEEYSNQAWIKIDQGDYDGAIADAEAAIRLNPENDFAFAKRGLARSRKGDKDGAIADYSEAIRLNSQYAEAYYNRGIAREQKGNLDGAIEDYSQSIRFNPNDDVAYGRRGSAHQQKGNLDGAIEDYSRSIRLNPNNDVAYGRRGFAHQQKGNLESAVGDYSEAIRLNPQGVTAYNNRGEIYFANQQYKEALTYFETANGLRLDYKWARAGLAITAHALGQIEQARTIWQSLISEDQHFQDAEWVRKELNWAEPLVEEARKLIAGL
jgi:tetratricopeptide (TPR) repeat protein